MYIIDREQEREGKRKRGRQWHAPIESHRLREGERGIRIQRDRESEAYIERQNKLRRKRGLYCSPPL